jgi:hypothetical protein
MGSTLKATPINLKIKPQRWINAQPLKNYGGVWFISVLVKLQYVLVPA